MIFNIFDQNQDVVAGRTTRVASGYWPSGRIAGCREFSLRMSASTGQIPTGFGYVPNLFYWTAVNSAACQVGSIGARTAAKPGPGWTTSPPSKSCRTRSSLACSTDSATRRSSAASIGEQPGRTFPPGCQRMAAWAPSRFAPLAPVRTSRSLFRTTRK